MRPRSSLKTVAALLAASALAVSGCGGGDDEAAAGEGETRTVESSFTGEKIEIPTEPKRVVALWRTGAMLTELGVKPVGQLEAELMAEEIPAEQFAEVKDTPVIGSWEGIDVEKVIEADPDLIIGMDNGGLGIDYEAISEVAPTVILKIAEPTDVWDNYPVVADLVGKTTDFEERDKALNERLAAIKDQYGDALADASATSLGYSESVLYVDTSKSLTYRRLEAAGFGYNPTYTDNPERYSAELATENLPSLNTSNVLLYDTGLGGEVSAENEKLLAMPSWKRLPAAAAGHAYPLTSGTIYTFEAADRQAADIAKVAEAYAAAQ
ncbi:ABC transporter substrate-binding protein [Mumia zhuanghuii]|uniref:ABC transporter substrate-binding protein n=1 Tax=Mumia zhuanghuii TaxID=2585211 RepID=UPI00362F2B3B